MMQWLKFVNQGGIPAIQCVAVTSNATTSVTTFSFNDHPYRLTHRFYGLFVVKFPNAITEPADNTVQFDTLGVGGSAVDVYYTTGGKLTVNNLTSSAQTVHLFFYDRDTNRVLMVR